MVTHPQKGQIFVFVRELHNNLWVYLYIQGQAMQITDAQRGRYEFQIGVVVT